GEIGILRNLDQRADPIDAPAVRERAADPADHLVEPAMRNHSGIDRLAAGRFFTQFRHVHVAKIREPDRAPNPPPAHPHPTPALLGEREPVVHAEAMLFVDHGEREVAKFDLLLEQGMSADQHMDVAERELLENIVALASTLATGEDGDVDARRGGERRYSVEV